MNVHKIVPWFIGMVFVFIIASWITMGVIAYKSIDAVNEHGVKGVIESVWCGKDTDCKLPESK